MDIDGGSNLHPDFFLSRVSSGQAPQLIQSDAVMSLEDRILHGQDENLIHATGANREEVLEILSKTENGRRRAEDVYGADVWNSRRGKTFEQSAKVDQSHPHDDKEVDKMFLDLTNVDQDDVAKKERQRERERDREHLNITAESFEAERNAMDMEDSE